MLEDLQTPERSEILPIVATLVEDSSNEVRQVAVGVLSRLPQSTLLHVVPELQAILLHADANAKCSVLCLLRKLPLKEVQSALSSVVSLLEGNLHHVQLASASILAKLLPDELVELVPQLHAILQRGDDRAMTVTLGVLSQLPHEELLKLAPDFVVVLEGSTQAGAFAARLLERLSADELLPLVPHLYRIMRFGEASAQQSVAALFAKLPQEELLILAPDLVSLLNTTKQSELSVLPPGTIVVGQVVKRRDRGSWGHGVVTTLGPPMEVSIHVPREEESDTYTWDEIEADPNHPVTGPMRSHR